MAEITSFIDLSNKRPRAFLRVTLGAGPRASGSAPITILMIGNKTAAAPSDPLTNDTMVQVFDEDEVVAKTGAGSELHRMYRRLTEINNQATVYIGAITQSGGAQAALTKALSGTATEDAVLEVTIGPDTPVEVAVSNGDAAATVIAAIIAQVNAVAHTPVIATTPASNLVLTAKCVGPRGNDIKVRTRWTTGTGAGLTFTTAPNGEALTGGTTNDDPTALLANTTAVRFHLTVIPYGDTAEATPLGTCLTHVTAQAQPLVGKRGRLVLGNAESAGTAQTFGNTDVNDELAQIAWAQLANETPAELAAALAARLSVGLGVNRAYNFDGETLEGMTPQWNLASQPTETEITSALNNGLTPFAVAGNEVQLVRSITALSRTVDGGSTFDFSVLDTHYVDASFFLADLLEENWPVAFKGFKLGVDIEGQVPPPGVATANTTKAWALGLLAPYENDLLENFDAVTKAASVFARNATAKGRVDAIIPVDIIELFHQFAADLRQVG